MPPSQPTDAAPAASELTLGPNLLSKAKGPHQCAPGDTYSVKLTVRATDGGSFDVVDAEPMQPVDSASGPAKDPATLDEEEEEAALGYKRPSRTPKFFA